MTDLLDAEQLGARIFAFRRRLFRLETLPAYAVPSDGDDFHRWRAGDLTLSAPQLEWMDTLRKWRAQGRPLTRVRVLSQDLTDYERYSCHIYFHNADAGEEIRVLRVGEHPVEGSGVDSPDFWLVDEDEAVRMVYDEDGAFLGAEVATTETARSMRSVRDSLWVLAEPFTEWWARHPELHPQRAT